MTRPLAIVALFAIFALSTCISVDAADATKKINVLLIAGDDIAPFHDWRDISESTREVLVDSGRFHVRICEEPLILESKNALAAYEAIVFTMYNHNLPTLSTAAKKNLIDFVSAGKGFYVQHLASASFKGWDEFGKLCGRTWVMGTSGHGPRGVFAAEIADADHPITKGMKGFKIFDELYAKLQGDTEIHPLVTADSDWSKKTEPLVFTMKYGKGRSVHNAFGHDYKAIKHPSMKKLICRGVEWAATGEVVEGDK